MTIRNPYSASALPARLLESLSSTAPDDVRELLRAGAPVPAFLRAVEVGDLAAASDVLRIAWYDVLRDGPQFGGIRRVLDEVPLTEMRDHPLLALALGLAYNADGLRRAKAGQYFAIATEGHGSARGELSTGERVLVCTGQSAALRVVGHYELSARAARGGMRAIEALGTDPAAEVGFLPRIYAQLGISLYYGGALTEALEAFQRGYAEVGAADPAGFTNLSMLAGVHAIRGDLPEALTYVELARGEPWSDVQRTTYTGTFYQLAEAVLAIESGEAIAAQGHLDAMRHDRRSIEHWVAIARVEALTALIARDPARGLARLESFADLRATEERSADNRQALASVRVLLHLAIGNLDSATAILARDAPDTAQSVVDRARLLLVGGQPGAALGELRAVAGEPQSSRTRAECLAITAAAALRTSTARRADAIVDQLGALMRETGQRLAIRLLPQDDVERVVASGIRLGYEDVFGGEQRSVFVGAHEPMELTPRELHVARALARTSSTAELAAELSVSVNTVKSQLRSVYRKLGVSTRDEAVAVAVDRHLL